MRRTAAKTLTCRQSHPGGPIDDGADGVHRHLVVHALAVNLEDMRGHRTLCSQLHVHAKLDLVDACIHDLPTSRCLAVFHATLLDVCPGRETTQILTCPSSKGIDRPGSNSRVWEDCLLCRESTTLMLT